MPKKHLPDLSRIPLCESDFLQDLSIELGKRLKSVRHQAGRLDFKVSEVEHEGEDLECFDATHWLGRGAYIQVVVLENRRANCMMREPFENKHDTARYTGFIVSFKDWEVSEVANLMRDSLRNEIGVRDIWQKLDQRK